jgi:hypothetical protein
MFQHKFSIPRKLSNTNAYFTEGYKGGEADKSLALKRNQKATGLKKCIYSTHYPLSSTHL